MSSRRETWSRGSRDEPAPPAGRPTEDYDYNSVGRAYRQSSSPSSTIYGTASVHTTPITVVEEDDDMKMPARPSRRSSPRPVPDFRIPQHETPPITPQVIAETLPDKGKGKTSPEGVTTKKKPGQKQMESSTLSSPKPLKKPPLIQYDPTLYDWVRRTLI